MNATYALGGYREYAAPFDLREVVENTWLYAGPEVKSAHRVLPDLTVAIALRCERAEDGSITDARITFTGPTDTVYIFRPHRGVHLEAIRLQPEWCRQLLGIDPREHHNQIVPLAEVSPRLSVRLEDRLLRTKTSSDALRVLIDIIRSLHDAMTPSRDTRLAHSALTLIRQSPMRIGAVARAIDISERHLRRVVFETAGASPKHYQRTLRLTRMMTTADFDSNPSWSRLAADMGFVDQSHLAQEVRAVTGKTPVELHDERRSQRVSEIYKTTADSIPTLSS
ncbi:MAG: helix-turn-helix domain-containing protein [Acidobacteriota bacterium]|nr:helix-turn-helix domain-containing protein [Acidobacteriota bacterium]